MKKLILPACLVAGTAVGAGMIALPMTLCKLGFLPTIALILGIWAVMYITTLIGAEINLRAGSGLPLGKLGQFYSGPLASAIGTFSLILLIYALICAYLYGGASVLQGFFEAYLKESIALKYIVSIYAVLLAVLLVAPVRHILQVNRWLFTGLLIFFGFLVVGLLSKFKTTALPWMGTYALNLTSWTEAIPLLSTSFGFQVVLHTLTNFCNQDPILIRRSIFWGSLIPAFVYIIWTLSTLGILYHEAPEAYAELQKGTMEVGQFIQILAQTAAWPIIQILASIISILAIIKSSIGVGLGLLQAWQEQLSRKILNIDSMHKIVAVLLTILPPLLVALFVPQLFLKALRFAGMISIIIAILLPVWLITRPKAKALPTFYPITTSSAIQTFCIVFGILVILCEVYNLLK